MPKRAPAFCPQHKQKKKENEESQNESVANNTQVLPTIFITYLGLKANLEILFIKRGLEYDLFAFVSKCFVAIFVSE